MRKCSLVTSLTAEKDMTQSGILYVFTELTRVFSHVDLCDLSGTISFFDAPKEIYTRCDSEQWMNPRAITDGEWMDKYLPDHIGNPDIVFFSALFSPDLILHSRLSHKIRQRRIPTAIGGNSLAALDVHQISFISLFFDYILIGHDVKQLIEQVLFYEDMRSRNDSNNRCKVLSAYSMPDFRPDFSLLNLKNFITVYSGHGCYYGKCNFCDYPARAQGGISLRAPEDVAIDLMHIKRKQPSISDIVLTQDCYTLPQLLSTTDRILEYCGSVPYNLMLRAESWIDSLVGAKLEASGCTDVFIGAEALDNNILKILNKGINVDDISHSIKVLADFVDVTIGLILFVPMVEKEDLDRQSEELHNLLPYLYSIEPEILTIVNGSYFARFPEKYGIELHAIDDVINDNWCFGMSQDIPWTMKDKSLIDIWFRHITELREICGKKVKQKYWAAIEDLGERIS